MADEITFVEQPLKVSGAGPSITGAQPLFAVIDVSDYDELDLWLGVFALAGTTPQLEVWITTAMDNSDETNWVIAGSFVVVSSSNTWQKLNVQNLLRYVRYNYKLTGTNPEAAFILKGMARSWR